VSKKGVNNSPKKSIQHLEEEMIEEEIKSKSIQLQNKKFSSPGLIDA